jgi:rapamycin-insensitive companion of mTOR
VLSKILTNGNTETRLFATQHCLFLLRDMTVGFAEWVVPLLMTQLYDIDVSVRYFAVRVLDEAFDTPENLHVAVSLSPDLSHLIQISSALLIRFISIPRGFELLTGYVEAEIDWWFEIGCLNYVARLEYDLSTALNSRGKEGGVVEAGPVQFTFFGKTVDVDEWDKECEVPKHFFGELVKTEGGRKLLEKRDYMRYWTGFVSMWGLKNVSGLALRKVKAVLWTLGHIGSSVEGLDLLLEDDLVEAIVNIAHYSEVFSLRGTACYVLGLISLTVKGAGILSEFEWDVGMSGVCVPREVGKLVCIPRWKYNGSWPDRRIKLRYGRSRFSELEVEIMKLVGSMASHISSSDSSKALSRYQPVI